MTKRIDGRTARGLRTRQRVHELILSAYIDLIRRGVPIPTARDVAERAGLSPRVIFKHFSDLRALRLASFNRILAQSREFFPRDISARGSAAQRLELFLKKQLPRLEYVTPIRRTAAMVEGVDPDVAKAMKAAHALVARDLEKALGPALKHFPRGEKRKLLTALHMICSWPSWEHLRAHHHLSPSRARSLTRSIALAVLAEAERRIRAAQSGAAPDGGQSSRNN